MPYNFEDLGIWEAYVPAPMPEWAQGMAMPPLFARRFGDGVDWYDFAREELSDLPEGTAICTAYKHPTTGIEMTMGLFTDASRAFPANARLLKITGIDPEDAAPWKLYEKRAYDPELNALVDLPEPVPGSVQDYQFAGQAADEKIITDDAAMDWVARGITPDALIKAVKDSVTDPDRQKRVLLFLAGTTVFPRNHELTPLLAASFGKDTSEKVDAFFLAASKR